MKNAEAIALGVLVMLLAVLCPALWLWVFWTLCGVGVRFFSWLPEAYHAPSFFEWTGLVLVAAGARKAIEAGK